ncbi:MAG: hypothetical protein MR383_06900 [Lachnospiraceae bacterium]|nr:hypothetical protein [Lachnospiraceae bacterium]
MTSLLEIRDTIKHFYSKHELYVKPVLKFLMALVCLLLINGNMGYMDTLKNPAIVLIVALMCSFMPRNFIVLVSALFVVLHSYSLAMECAAAVLAVFLLLLLLYFRFTPRNTLVVLLTPLLFAVKIPYVMPIAIGLLGGPISIIAVSCGVVVRFMISYMEDNFTVFSAQDAETGSQKLRLMIDGILDNKAMLVTIIVFALTAILVYTIRKMSINYAWNVAIIIGIATEAILLLICEFMMDLNFSVLEIIIGSVVSLFICQAIRFMEFNVDYSRTEVVQFEDDEYYYYVKAVPKNMVAAPQKRVKRINKQQKKVVGKQVKKVSTIKTAHGVSRTTVSRMEDKNKH